MVKLLAECSKCGSPVTDSLETEIEQHGKVKTGSYTNGRWMCHSCIEYEEGKNKNGKLVDDSSSAHIDKCETIGVANESDVSPNTPRADGTSTHRRHNDGTEVCRQSKQYGTKEDRVYSRGIS